MEKSRFTKKFSFFSGLLILAATLSCNIGLGEMVDTEKPEVFIENPTVDSKVRSNFIMDGTCSDDSRIEKILVSLKNTETKAVVITKEAEIARDSKTWTCSFETVNEDGSLIISDGSYEATARILDGAGRESTATRSFSIDNTPPILVLTRPSTMVGAETSDTYGQTFTLTGQSSDDSNIDSLEVSIYSDKECTNLLATVPLNNVPPTINLTVAEFSGEDGIYKKIYGEDLQAGTKQFYCVITAYDAARKIPAVEGDKGNSATYYYLYNDIYSSVLSNFKLTDLYAIMNGSFTGNEEQTALALEVRKILEDGEKSARQYKGQFSLNPLNNPSFIMNGYEALKKDDKGIYDFAAMAHAITNGGKVTFKATSGLDNIPLVNDTLGVYAYKCNAKGEKTGENPVIVLQPLKDRDGNVLITDEKKVSERAARINEIGTYDRNIVVELKKELGFEIGQYYLAEVCGYDEKGNEINNHGILYGFRFNSTGAPADLSVKYYMDDDTVPNADGVKYLSESRKIRIKGVTSHEEATVNDPVKIDVLLCDPSDVDATTKEPKIVKTIHSDFGVKTEDGSFELEVPGTVFEEHTKSYQIKVVAKYAEVNTVERASVLFDADVPEVKITSVTPVVNSMTDESVSLQNVNGKIAIKGSITDTYEVESAEYKIYAEGSENNPLKAGNLENFPDFEFKDVDTSNYDRKNLVIAIDAKDKSGNVNHFVNKTYFIDQSTDMPVLEWNEEQREQIAEGMLRISKNSNFTLGVKDDDLLEGVSVKLVTDDGTENLLIKPNPGSDKPEEKESIDNSSYGISVLIPNKTGDFTIEIKAKDNGGKETVFTKPIRVSSEPPVVILENETRYISKAADAVNNSKLVLKGTVTGSAPMIFKGIRQKTESDVNETVNIGEQIFELTEDEKSNGITEKEFNFEITVNAGKLNATDKNKKNGKLKFDLVFEDNNRQKSYSEVEYIRDDVKPVVAIITPEANKTGVNSVNSKSLTIKGTTTETGAIEKNFYKLDGDADWAELSATKSWILSKDVEEGNHTLYVKSIDKAGNESVELVRHFGVDESNPVVETYINSETEKTENAATVSIHEDLKVKVVVSDSYKLGQNPCAFTVKRDGEVISSGYNFDSISGDAKKKTYSFTLPSDAPDGHYLLEIVASDAMGKTTKESRNILYDRNAPNLIVANENLYDETIWQTSNNIVIKGTASDATGVQQIWYTTDTLAEIPASDKEKDESWSSAWKKASGTTNWEIELNMSDGKKDDSNHTLKIATVDPNGFADIQKTLKLNVDGTKPELSVNTSLPEFMPKDGIDLSVDFSDTYELSKGTSEKAALIIKQEFTSGASGTTTPEVDIGYITLVDGDNLKTQSRTIKIPLKNRRPETGTYKFTIEVQDIAGNKAEKWESLPLQSDLTPPVIILNTPVAGSGNVSVSKGKNAINTKNSKYRFEGTTSDEGSSVETVEWQIVEGSADSAAPDDNNWNTAINGSIASWNIAKEMVAGNTVDPTGDQLKEGTYTIFVRCKDKAKNVSNLIKREFDVDLSAPVVTVAVESGVDKSSGSGDSKSTRDKGFKFVYSADDTAGLAPDNPVITVTKDDIPLANTAYTDSARVITFTSPADGVYKVHIKATDIFGKSTEKEAQIRLDTKGPVVNLDSPDLSKWQNDAKFSIRGTNDDETGVSEVWYAIDPEAASGTEYKVSDFTSANGWKELTGKTTSWSVDYNLGKDKTSFEGKFAVAALDRNGNVTVEKYDLKVDTKEPEIGKSRYTGASATTNLNDISNSKIVDLTNGGKIYVRRPTEKEKEAEISDQVMKLSGTVSDNHKIENLILTAQKENKTFKVNMATGVGTDTDGEHQTKAKYSINGEFNVPYVPEGQAGAPAEISDYGTWDWEIELPFTYFGQRQGEWNLLLELEDSSGQQASQSTIIVVDISEPETLNVSFKDEPKATTEITEEDNSKTVLDWYVDSAVEYVIKCVDNVSGISLVEYSVDDGTSWVPLLDAGNNQYKGTVNFNVTSQGAKTVKFRATDMSGNTSTISNTVYFDTVDPEEAELAEVTEGADTSSAYKAEEDVLVNGNVTNDEYLVNGEKNIVVYVSAKDKDEDEATISSGLKTVKITKIGSTAITSDAGELITDASHPFNGYFKLVIPKGEITDSSGTVIAETEDKVGNKTEANLFLLNIDKTSPSITMEDFNDADPSTNTVYEVNGIIPVKGTASDNQTVDHVTVEYSTDGGTNWTTLSGVSGTSSWNGSLDTTIFATGTATKEVEIRATAFDKAGNSNSDTKTVKVCQQTDRPVITLNNIAITGMSELTVEKSVWFKERTIYGSVTDDDGLKKDADGKSYINVKYTKVDEEGVTGTHRIPVSGSSFEFSFTTVLGGTTKLTDGMYKLEFEVTDASDTTGKTFSSLGTEATDLDKPVVKDSASFVSTVTESTAVMLKLDTIAPTIGTIWITNDVDENGRPVSGAVWKDTELNKIPLGGTEHPKFAARFELTDANGIMDLSSNETESGCVVELSGAGTYKVFDSTGIQKSGDLYEVWNLPATGERFNKTEEALYLTVTARDKADKTKVYKETLYADNAAPEVNFVTNKSVYNGGGSETISFTSETGSNLYLGFSRTQVDEPSEWKEITLGGNTSRSTTLIFDGASGQKHFGNLNDYLISLGITTNEAIADASFTTVTPVYLWVKAVDSFGNTNNTAKLEIRVNPQGDIPTITIDSPEADTTRDPNGENNSKYVPYVGGKPKLYGTIDDPAGNSLGVESVWVQIISTEQSSAKVSFTGYNEVSKFDFGEAEINYLSSKGYELYDMTADESSRKEWKTLSVTEKATVVSNGKTSNWAILVNPSTSSWSLRLNGNNEFDPTGTNQSNPVVIRVWAKDNDKKLSLPSDCVLEFDNVRPVIGEEVPLYLVQSDSDAYESSEEYPVSVQYKYGMYIKAPEAGNWYLIGSVRDNKVNSLGIGDTAYIRDGSNKMGTSIDLEKVAGSETEIVRFKHKLSLTETVGTIDMKLEAQDDGNNISSVDMLIKYDTQAPVLADSDNRNYGIKPKIQQSNYFYRMQSEVTESAVNGVSQSGLDKVAVYFKRAGTIKKLYNPLLNENNSVSLENVQTKAQIDGSTTDGTIIEDSNLYWVYKKLGTRDENLLNKISLTSDDANIHVNSLVQMGGVMYNVNTKSGNDIELDGNPDRNLNYALFALASIIDNTVEESPAGERLEDGYYERLTSDDGDRLQEYVEKTSSGYIWSAYFCSRNIPDGPIEIHYVAFDKAGNYSHGEETSAFVTNNSPRIAKVRFGTDLNLNDTIDTEEWEDAYKSQDYQESGTYDEDVILKKLVTTTTLGSSTAPYKTVKGKTQVNLDIVGGNNDLWLIYNIPESSSGANDGIKGKRSRKLGSKEAGDFNKSSEYTFTLQAGDLSKAGDRENSLCTFQIWDSTEGVTRPNDVDTTADYPTYAELKVWMGIAVADVTPPTAVIHPFYWNSLSDNSIAGSGTDVAKKNLLGHIELEKDLNFTYDNNGTQTRRFTSGGTGINDLDPKVSGQIVIKGHAHDNKLLQYIYLKVPGMTLTSTAHSTETGFYRMATYADGSWTGSNGTGFTFSIDEGSESFANGHDVDWTFTWDTSNLSTVVGTDVEVEVLSEDWGKPTYPTTSGTIESIDGTTNYSATPTYGSLNPSVPGTTQTAEWNADFTARGDETGYYKMDVVGYVTEVVTSLSTMKSNNPSVYNRSSLGHYPVQSVVKNVVSGKLSNTDSETVRLKGFNLAKTPQVTGVDSDSVTVSGSDVTFDVSDLPSGIASITINSIPVINNLNNNDAKGDATTDGTNKANWYNRQANGDNNNNLNDDIIFDVWEFNDQVAVPNAQAIGGTTMKINQNSKMIQYAFSNGILFNMGNGTTNSNQQWIKGWDTFQDPSIGFAVDNAGYTYGVGHPSDTNGSDAIDRYGFTSSRWGVGHTSDNKGLHESRTNTILLEGTGHKINNVLTMARQRIQSSSLATVGNHVYLAYYDSLNKEIRFRAGTIGDTSGAFDMFIDSEPGAGDGYSLRNSQLIAKSTLPNRGAGQYVSIDAYYNGTNDVVVAVWFDKDANALRYSYKNNPLKDVSSDKNNATAANWSTVHTLFASAGGGQYGQVAIDPKGGVHVAAYAGNGHLYYAYASGYNQAFTEQRIDATDLVGQHLTLDTALDSEGNAVPYIGYYSSKGKAKYAHPVTAAKKTEAGVNTDGSYTENWDISMVPSKNAFSMKVQDKVNVGVWRYSDGKLTQSNPKDAAYSTATSKTGLPESTYTTTSSTTYGNGSSNGVLVYQIVDPKKAKTNCLESAQLR